MSQKPSKPEPAPGERDAARAVPWIVVLVATVVYAMIAWLASASGLGEGGRPAYDEAVFHLAEVQRLAAEPWSVEALRGSRSATSPGYHLVLSLAARGGLDGAVALRWVGLVFSVGLLGTVAWWVGWVGGFWGWAAGGLVAVLAASGYVVGSAGWVGPENAGWCGVAGVMLLAVSGPMRGWRLVAAGAVLVALVAVRQSHLWAAAVIWTAAWLTPEAREPGGRWWWVRDWSKRVPAAVWGVVATLPAFAVVGWLAWVWGGLVPPNFQGGVIDPRSGQAFPTNTGANLSAVPMTLALFGFFGLWFAAAVWGAVQARARVIGWARIAGLVLIGGVVGGVLAAIPASTYSVADGRFGGVWRLAGLGPMGSMVVGDRSLVIIAMAAAGGAAIVWMGVALGGWRERLVLLSGVVGHAASLAATANAWQRYAEPMVLLVLIAATALCWRSSGPVGRGSGRASEGMIWGLAVVQGGLAWWMLRGGV